MTNTIKRYDFTSDGINVINGQDRHNTTNRYILTVMISNALVPRFLAYAFDEVDALNALDEYANDKDYKMLTMDYSDVIENYEPHEIDNELFMTDSGNYINLSYIHMEQLTR